jgi:hypothetical protein
MKNSTQANFPLVARVGFKARFFLVGFEEGEGTKVFVKIGRLANRGKWLRTFYDSMYCRFDLRAFFSCPN